jgi:hypothetical protein
MPRSGIGFCSASLTISPRLWDLQHEEKFDTPALRIISRLAERQQLVSGEDA